MQHQQKLQQQKLQKQQEQEKQRLQQERQRLEQQRQRLEQERQRLQQQQKEQEQERQRLREQKLQEEKLQRQKLLQQQKEQQQQQQPPQKRVEVRIKSDTATRRPDPLPDPTPALPQPIVEGERQRRRPGLMEAAQRIREQGVRVPAQTTMTTPVASKMEGSWQRKPTENTKQHLKRAAINEKRRTIVAEYEEALREHRRKVREQKEAEERDPST